MTLQEFFDSKATLWIRPDDDSEQLELLHSFIRLDKKQGQGSDFSERIYLHDAIFSNTGRWMRYIEGVPCIRWKDIEVLECPFCHSVKISRFEDEEYCLKCGSYKVGKWKKVEPKPFLVGDKIRIKSWEKMKLQYGMSRGGQYIECEGGFTEEMKSLCGKISTITSMQEGFVGKKYVFTSRDLNSYFITSDMMEHVK